jgi:ElaB/YqjD/DUF883 family membrane-anchored ribosome-binding protein
MRSRLILAVSGLALAVGAPALAQKTKSGGTSGSTSGQDVNAGTSGYGSTDGNSITVGGTADAAAANGGTASTRTRANVNDKRGMQHSTAKARDEDERARSRTHTIVRQGEVVRSRTSTMYKQKGEKPVRTNDTYRSDKPN